MTKPEDDSRRVLTVELVIDADIERLYLTDRPHRARQRTLSRPLLCATREGAVLAHPAWLPFQNERFDEIRLVDQLELIRREEDLLAEIARLLRPGGRLVLRVPATGPLAGFDSFNLSRYLVDLSRHGPHPVETNEIGWRKHYPPENLEQMLAKARLTVVSLRRSRFIFSELLGLLVQTRYRWLRFDPLAYDRANRRLDAMRRFEDRLHFAGGFLITIVATKPE